MAKLEASVAYAVYPVSERVRLCMLDGVFVNRSAPLVSAERAELLSSVSALQASVRKLQTALTTDSDDPSGLASPLSVGFVSFENAPAKPASQFLNASSRLTRGLDAQWGATSLLGPLGSDGSSALVGSPITTVSGSTASRGILGPVVTLAPVRSAAAVHDSGVVVRRRRCDCHRRLPRIKPLRDESAGVRPVLRSTLDPRRQHGSGRSVLRAHARVRCVASCLALRPTSKTVHALPPLCRAIEGATTNHSSPAHLLRSPLIIFVFMIIIIAISGFGVILPNLCAVESLQNQLAQSLQALPLVLLRALELQASRRADYLRKQLDISLGGTADDDLEGDDASLSGEMGGGEDAALLPTTTGGPMATVDGGSIAGGGVGGAGTTDIVEADGEVSWSKVVALARRDAAFAAGARRAAAAGSATTTSNRCRAARSCLHVPPLGLLIFLAPAVLLVPFYAAMYAMTQGSVSGMLAAQDFFSVATKRAGLVSTSGSRAATLRPTHLHPFLRPLQAAESGMDAVMVSAAVGVPGDAQGYVAAAWQSLVDLQVRWTMGGGGGRGVAHTIRGGLAPLLQAHNNYLVYLSTGSSRPLGTGADANPAPSAFDASLPHSELTGVPGVAADRLADVTTAMLTDACPLVTKVTGASMAECYRIAGGQQHGGLIGATARLLSLGQSIVQAKADQVAAAQLAGSLVLTEGPLFSASAAVTSNAMATYRALAGRLLAPAFAYIVSRGRGVAAAAWRDRSPCRLCPCPPVQADLYADASLSTAAAAPPLLVTFTAIYTLIFTAIVVGVLLPLISSIARDLHRKRGLILVLPVHAIVGLPDVRALVLRVINEAEAAFVDRGRPSSRAGGSLSGGVRRGSDASVGAELSAGAALVPQTPSGVL